MNTQSSKKTVKRKKPSYFYSIVSVALVLFILGLVALLMLEAQRLIVFFKEKVSVVVEMREESDRADAERVTAQLLETQFVKPNSIQFTSKEEALERLQEDFGEDLARLGMENPLYNVVSFHVHAKYMHKDSLQNIQSLLRSDDSISDVFYHEGLVDGLQKNIRRLGITGLFVGILFILIACVLIHNTIKLALYSNRFLIKNMQLVGASWGFITRPYITRSVINGFLSAGIAIAGVLLIVYFVERKIPELNTLYDYSSLFFVLLCLILLSLLITVFSTYFSVNKYLKMRLDDLY